MSTLQKHFHHPVVFTTYSYRISSLITFIKKFRDDFIQNKSNDFCILVSIAPSGGAVWFQHLSEAEHQLVFLCSQSDGVTVAHGEVHLTTVAPQGRRVGWHPRGEQPGTAKITTINSAMRERETKTEREQCCLYY